MLGQAIQFPFVSQNRTPNKPGDPLPPASIFDTYSTPKSTPIRHQNTDIDSERGIKKAHAASEMRTRHQVPTSAAIAQSSTGVRQQTRVAANAQVGLAVNAMSYATFPDLANGAPSRSRTGKKKGIPWTRTRAFIGVTQSRLEMLPQQRHTLEKQPDKL